MTADARAVEAERSAANRRVLRQLIESFVFEGLVAPSADGTAGPSPTGAEAWALDIPGPADPGGNGGEAWPGADTGRVTYRWRARRRLAFGRPGLTGPLTRDGGDRGGPAPGVEPEVRRAVVELARGLGAAPERVAGLVDELERTARNDAEALAAWRERPVPGDDATADELESWTVSGHPYHPSYKSRVGFDPDDNRRYGPEFAPTVRPLWLALPRGEVEVTAVRGLDPAAYVEADLGPATVDRFRRHLRFRPRFAGTAPAAGTGAGSTEGAGTGAGPAVGTGDHVWVPVHPWQWRERLAHRLAGEVAGGRVVVLGEADDAYRPQQSIRTLANATRPSGAVLKLALGIVNTSTARTLAAHTLRNGPLITGWLRGIVADDPVLRDEQRVAVLGEVVTASYAGPGPELPTGPDGNLGCLWREPVASVLDPGEGAVPFTTLAQRRPDGACWVAPWLARHGPERWAARLLEVAVTPVAHLLCAHGVALEAHAQNLLLTHRDGWPERLVVRDLHDGIRFSRRHLAEPDRVPGLAPTPEAHLRVNRNSFIEAADPASVRDFVADAFFFVNLAEVGFALAAPGPDGHVDTSAGTRGGALRDLAVDERRFWGLARGVVERHRARFPSLSDRFTTFDLLAPTIGIEALTTRRLLPDDRLRTVTAPNPLATVAAL